MSAQTLMSGRIIKAPEGHLPARQVEAARKARRGFMGKALALGAGVAAPTIARAADGDPAILTLPEHSKGLGQGVTTEGYGKPSVWEKAIQRRESPGLTRVPQASVSFCPLQSLFGIITPSGLHFERHHQGWWDVDPSGHRLMVNGLVKAPRVFTMDDLMRLPSVSRIHFIECGATARWSGPTRPCPRCNTRTAWCRAPNLPACAWLRCSTSAAPTRKPAATCWPKAPTVHR